eukprot:gnl/TRDRNA2_/TRDRNA2_135210_c0_seq4.p1 gnl/TRDRNA2_/TRDRNA2_135210_c0~~gnl/TRDRNA2_/TRDRNA2_135210_c0_seq4.p1  ORF type:complete len:399 (+),score=64.72 gnl/TRDRNA2_/TRDRNA2_135210_c0_seq4:62-1198(+)
MAAAADAATAAPGASGVASERRVTMLSLSFAVNVAGIYVCFVSCSLLHEAIYREQAPGGQMLSPWVVNVLESAANTCVAIVGMLVWEGIQPMLPQRSLASTGALQVMAKYCASASRTYGVPGPVLTLVKTARPLPVMLGQGIIAGSRYSLREYCQYSLIVAASVLVGTAKSPLPTDGVSGVGLLFVALSMACDGYVGGRQQEMKSTARSYRSARGIQPESIQPFELQFFTNIYMGLTAALFAVSSGNVGQAVEFFSQVPGSLSKVVQYAACSAVGQIFVFRCLAQLNPLILSLVTSSRKLVSVMLTLIVFGYEVSGLSICGLILAIIGFVLIFMDETKYKQKSSAVRDEGETSVQKDSASTISKLSIRSRSPRTEQVS